jgi:CRISPR/Cas system-associated exonuclease Cas4 (RecB family)
MSTYDTRSALWASHSSISEYRQCPRAYYLHYVYRDPHTNHKITLMSPPLALGQVVHDVLEELSVLPTAKRFEKPLTARFEQGWKQVAGLKGGFRTANEEADYKERGLAMMRRVMNYPGPLAELSVKIKMDLPHYWLSEPDGIILCGRIDWLAYDPGSDSIAIIDFKTSKKEEVAESLQLPIYLLLTTALQKRPVTGASYWYLEVNDAPTRMPLPDPDEARKSILGISKEMALARKLNRFECRTGGCRTCKPFEAILAQEAQYVYTNSRNQDVYVLEQAGLNQDVLSEIL